MRLRTQLSLAIVVITVVPLLLQGLLYYHSHRRDLSEAALNHLQSVASIQQSRLTAILQQNAERLALVASRTQLRINLDRLESTGDADAAAGMNRILHDAAASIADIVAITVYDRDGVAVAATDEAVIGRPHFDPAFFAECSRRTIVDRMHLDEAGETRIYLSGPMTLEDRFLGVMVISARVENLLASLSDFSGLGQTGETILARLNEDGHFVFLAPTRFAPSTTLKEFREVAGRAGAGRALFRDVRNAHWLDYRDVAVMAATREVPGTDWYLAVKIDRDEAFRGLVRTATMNLTLVTAFGVLVVIVGLRYARGLSRPLSELAEAAAEISAGNYGRRVAVRSADEIGVLETTFNSMSGEIAETRARLEGKIAELNQALADIRTLAGIIPICAACKKIRDDQGYWNQLESYLTAHSDARFSHGLCPDCLREFENDLDDE